MHSCQTGVHCLKMQFSALVFVIPVSQSNEVSTPTLPGKY